MREIFIVLKKGIFMKKIIAIITLSALITGTGINASSNTTIISCCNATGNNIVLVGPCTCIGAVHGGRARGDQVTYDTRGIMAKPLITTQGAVGAISVPKAGEVDLYQFGDIKIIFASFYLQNQKLNPKVSPAMQKIITAAAQKNPWAKTMIWVGRQLPKEAMYIEMQETYTGMEDLAQASRISYEVVNSKKIQFTIPASKNAGEQVITADFSPIKK
jgi:hypothetical protein